MQSARNLLVAGNFGARAETYEQHADLQRCIADRLALLLPSLESPRVLELGCGTGLLSRHLLARYLNGSFLFTDVAQAMLEQCRLNVGREGRGRARFALMDGNAPGLGGRSFDLIATSMALHWLSDPLQSLQLLRSRLRPDGLLIFAALGPESFVEWRSVLDDENMPSGVIRPVALPGIIAEERTLIDASTLSFLRRMKRVGGRTPREGYAKLSAGELRRAIRLTDAKHGGRITWHIVYGCLGSF
jgi:malonyl-CoA O-methyltransferase